MSTTLDDYLAPAPRKPIDRGAFNAAIDQLIFTITKTFSDEKLQTVVDQLTTAVDNMRAYALDQYISSLGLASSAETLQKVEVCLYMLQQFRTYQSREKGKLDA